MFCHGLIALALFALPALAAPSPLLHIFKTRNPLPRRYIVTLKQDTVDVESYSSSVSSASNVTHKWESMNAFAGEFSDKDLETFRADPCVEAIEEDGIMKTSLSVTQYAQFSSDLVIL